METVNQSLVRIERGRWQEVFAMWFTFEDLPRDDNVVIMSSDDARRPETICRGYSEYAQRGIDQLYPSLPKLIEGLPVES